MNSIYTRRSVRTFSDKVVEEEKVIQLVKAGMQAPCAMNQQASEFIVIKSKELREELAPFKNGGKLIVDAQVAIVIAANESKMKSPLAWEQDLGATTQNVLLEAVNLGLGAVWLGCAPHEDRMSKVIEVLNLPEGIKPYSVIAVGYPKEENANKFVDRFDESRLHFEKF